MPGTPDSICSHLFIGQTMVFSPDLCSPKTRCTTDNHSIYLVPMEMSDLSGAGVDFTKKTGWGTDGYLSKMQSPLTLQYVFRQSVGTDRPLENGSVRGTLQAPTRILHIPQRCTMTWHTCIPMRLTWPTYPHKDGRIAKVIERS
jgi:hypothetical protein